MPAPQSNWIRFGVIAALLLIVAAFLAGFVPQYRKAAALEQQLAGERTQMESLRTRLGLAGARDFAGILYLELTRKNYGIAQPRASALFDHIRGVVSSLPEGESKNSLHQILGRRDEIVSAIAKADPAVEGEVGKILEQLHGLQAP